MSADDATVEPPTEDAVAAPSAARALAASLVDPLLDALVGLGDWTLFSLRATSGVFTKHMKRAEFLRACVEIGVGSFGVVAVTGVFIGMVLAVQAYNQFHTIGLDTSLGAVIHMSIIRELGPVLAAVMLAGRVGTAMAAQLATMRVTEQIDALACLGVDPVKFLVAPRFLACVVMIPLLTVVADCVFGGRGVGGHPGRSRGLGGSSSPSAGPRAGRDAIPHGNRRTDCRNQGNRHDRHKPEKRAARKLPCRGPRPVAS